MPPESGMCKIEVISEFFVKTLSGKTILTSPNCFEKATRSYEPPAILRPMFVSIFNRTLLVYVEVSAKLCSGKPIYFSRRDLNANTFLRFSHTAVFRAVWLRITSPRCLTRYCPSLQKHIKLLTAKEAFHRENPSVHLYFFPPH